MISPAKLDKLPDNVVDLISRLQDDIVSDICRRVTKANYLTSTAEWHLYKANQLNLSYAEVNRRIARQLKTRERDVQALYTETVKQALKEDGDIYRIAAAQGKLSSDTGDRLNNYFRSASFSQLLSKGIKNCTGQMRNLCNSMAAGANRTLSNAMDYAHIKVISGAYSYTDAVYSAVKELADKGISRVEYPSGHVDRADVAVRRAVLSSVNKSCCDLQLDLAKNVGSELVEVTAHMGARPSHAEWQGQIYSLVKGHPKYRYFYDATGYGTGGGLGGWNCRHNFFPYFEGIDTPYHSPDFSKTENNEYYALTQQQRAYERAVRRSKTELAALDGSRNATDNPELRAKLDTDFSRKSVTLKNREARLNAFIKANDLQRDNSRVRVVGFGKSVSQKTVAANRKAAVTSVVNLKSDLYPGTAFKPIEYFSSKEYREKFTKLDGLNLLSRNAVYESAKKAIVNNYGNMSETAIIISRTTGIKYYDNDFGGLNASFKLPLGKKNQYVLVHNHPNNGPLSIDDILTLNQRSDIRTMIAAGHDGKIYWLEIGNGKRLNNLSTEDLADFHRLWQRTVAENKREHYKSLLIFCKKYGWNGGFY